jgi:hypothetical protein
MAPEQLTRYHPHHYAHTSYHGASSPGAALIGLVAVIAIIAVIFALRRSRG